MSVPYSLDPQSKLLPSIIFFENGMSVGSYITY